MIRPKIYSLRAQGVDILHLLLRIDDTPNHPYDKYLATWIISVLFISDINSNTNKVLILNESGRL